MKLRVVFDKCENRYFLQEKGWFKWYRCCLWDFGIPNGNGNYGFTTQHDAELYAKQYRTRMTAAEILKIREKAPDRFEIVNGNV